MPGLAAGADFAGYHIDGVAGEGGMGVVYHATDVALERPVALKLIADEFSHDRKFRRRFQRESRIAASIDHPNVIPIYEAGEVDGELFIAMRFIEGPDLFHALMREGPLEGERAVRIVRQVASALDAAHRRRLVHRDIKPGNVLLAGEGDEEHAYLTDFGLVKPLSGDGTRMTTVGRFVGTLDYASPEEIQGHDADARSDVYSLGCVLFYALTGTSPFLRDSNMGTIMAHVNEPPPSLLEAAPGLPPALADVVERALAKNPDERYQTAGEFGRAARDALSDTRAPPRGSADTPQPRFGGHPPPGDASDKMRSTAQDRAAAGPPRAARLLGIVLPVLLVLGLIAATLAAFGVL